ncbi:MAG: hypothetical protein CR997_09820 [Acidobacteria bacterium]|nr:MAG: hypothetical protein CR997_09820 [Acidobacteriota bacterium]
MTLLDEQLKEVLTSDHAFLMRLHERFLSLPGKRLRPALLFLCAKMLHYQGRRHIKYATVFELIHTATLIHDDVIDEAETRRGVRTLNQEENNALTILFGDLLYTKANTLAISGGSLEVMDLISSVTEEMIEGEILQDKLTYVMDISEEDYFNILTRKTAFLFGATAKAAAMTANCSAEECEALYQYGFNLGISFQLVDDLLDYTGDEFQMGKPVLSDLQAGKMTLPVIRFLRDHREDVKPLIEKIWNEKNSQALNQLALDIKKSASYAETMKMSEEHANKAISYLDPFPENTYKDILKAIPLFMLNRKQ